MRGDSYGYFTLLPFSKNKNTTNSFLSIYTILPRKSQAKNTIKKLSKIVNFRGKRFFEMRTETFYFFLIRNRYVKWKKCFCRFN